MQTKQWTVGDRYWEAEGEMHGHGHDLGNLGEPCETADEARNCAREWLGSLTKREREYATAWVRQYEVTAIDEDGSIGSAVSLAVGESVEW